MTLDLPFKFALALFREDRTSLGTVAVKHDWEPAIEWTRFYFLRKGLLPIYGNGKASVLPVWDEKAGEPYCSGYRVELATPLGHAVGMDFPKTRFRSYASALSSRFVESGELREGELFSFALIAYPSPPEAPSAGGLSLNVSDSSPALPVRKGSLKNYLGRAIAHGPVNHEDMPVFVSERVLSDFAAQTRAHEGTETGGILIGLLWQDEDEGEIFVEITDQIPAEYTEGTDVKLTFTPETWAAAGAALRLRGRGEIYTGFIHSHPTRFWCQAKKCSLEEQKSCKFAEFFSGDDESVLRAAFPGAYSVGIVANDTAFAGITFSMYGNRRGITSSPRSFHVLKEESNGA